MLFCLSSFTECTCNVVFSDDDATTVCGGGAYVSQQDYTYDSTSNALALTTDSNGICQDPGSDGESLGQTTYTLAEDGSLKFETTDGFMTTFWKTSEGVDALPEREPAPTPVPTVSPMPTFDCEFNEEEVCVAELSDDVNGGCAFNRDEPMFGSIQFSTPGFALSNTICGQVSSFVNPISDSFAIVDVDVFQFEHLGGFVTVFLQADFQPFLAITNESQGCGVTASDNEIASIVGSPQIGGRLRLAVDLEPGLYEVRVRPIASFANRDCANAKEGYKVRLFEGNVL